MTTSGCVEIGASSANSSGLYFAEALDSGARIASLGEPMISV